MAVPTYPGLRIALPNRREIARRIEAARRMRSISRPKGRSAGRCGPIAAATSSPSPPPTRRAFRNMSRCAPAFPTSVGYAVLRQFHAAASMTMVATDSLRQELGERGFRRLGFWTRGVDTELFRPGRAGQLDLPRPIFMTMGRVAVEKNLEAFLVARPARLQGRDRRRPAEGGAASSKYPGRDVPRREEGQGADRASCGRRRLRVPEPDRYVRRGAARGAGLRHAGCGVSGDRAARRHRRSSDRRDRQ